jgi:hypothetical protein
MPANASLLPSRKITGTNDVRTKRFEVIKALLHQKQFGREIHALARCALLAENEPKRSRFAKMQVVPQYTVHLKPETYLRSKKRAAVLSIRKSAIYFLLSSWICVYQPAYMRNRERKIYERFKRDQKRFSPHFSSETCNSM